MGLHAYYNENDPYAADWLRELIKAGEIPDGEVDERSIRDVAPVELGGFAECHFFAGIGVWARAKRDSGVDFSGRTVWTGSCPCQPFSSAGQGGGFADERHLWPDWFWLIRQCRPDLVFGEQVASRDGLAWLDLVCADMEGEGYAIGPSDTCAAGFGAPHIRQRIYFVTVALGDSQRAGLEGHGGDVRNGHEPGRVDPHAVGSVAEAGGAGGMANTDGGHPGAEWKQRGGQLGLQPESGGVERVDDTAVPRQSQAGGRKPGKSKGNGLSRRGASRSNHRPGPVNGFWADADWLHCRDGKWRPVEPGTSPLASGVAGRVGLLRGFGNGLVRPQATAFIQAACAALEDVRAA